MPCTSSVGAAVSAIRPARSSRAGRSECSSCAVRNALRENPARAGRLALLRRQLAHVVVEAGDLHAAGARVVHLREQRRQLADRVARRAARRARVHVLDAGLERDGETHQAAQPVRDRRLAGGGPDRVRHDDRIGRERRRPAPASPATAAASPAAKFGLPISSSSSHRNWMLARTPLLQRQARAVERGQRRPLVVGRAAREPARGAGGGLTVARQLERRRPPAVGRRRAARPGGCRR